MVRTACSLAVLSAVALLQTEPINADGIRRRVDCKMSKWSEYEACGSSGYKSRTRSVEVAPSFGGSPCPATMEQATCSPNECWVNNWNGWKCNSRTGMKSRTRTVASRGNGRAKCPPLLEYAVCDPIPCVVKTLAKDEGPWGACELNARGQWIKTKVLGIQTPAKYGGICPNARDSSRRVTQSCAPENCVVNSVEDDAGAWGECTTDSSGQYTKTKVLGIRTPALYGGTCPKTSDPIRTATEACEPVFQPVSLDCELYPMEEDTGAWGACTDNGTGTWYKSKVLGIKTPEQNGGSCPSADDPDRTVKVLCTPADCEVNTEAEDMGSWDPCQADGITGQWYQSKVLGIKTIEQFGGSCPSDSARTVRKLCEPIDCVLNSEEEDTGTWDSCKDDGTSKWFQKKVLGVKTPEQFGGVCPAVPDDARSASQLCPPVDCVINSDEEDTGTFDSCQDDGTGKWFQKKVVGVNTPEEYGGSCPSTDDPLRIVSKPCAPVDCEVNSLAEDTGSWDACKDNGKGQWFQNKVLGVKIPEMYGGSCPSATDPIRTASQLCPPVNCVIRTPAEDRGSFSTCSRGTDWRSKYKVKVLAIKVPAMYGGTACPPTSARLVKQYCTFNQIASSTIKKPTTKPPFGGTGATQRARGPTLQGHQLVLPDDAGGRYLELPGWKTSAGQLLRAPATRHEHPGFSMF